MRYNKVGGPVRAGGGRTLRLGTSGYGKWMDGKTQRKDWTWPDVQAAVLQSQKASSAISLNSPSPIFSLMWHFWSTQISIHHHPLLPAFIPTYSHTQFTVSQK